MILSFLQRKTGVRAAGMRAGILPALALTFAGWLTLQPEFSWRMAWEQKTLLYNPGVRPLERAP